MKKIIASFMAIIVFSCNSIINYPVEISANETKIPFTIHAEKSDENQSPSIIIYPEETLKLTITAGHNKERNEVYSGIISEKQEIENIIDNQIYNISLKTSNNDLYIGTFSTYVKPDSDFVGISSDISKVKQKISDEGSGDNERSVSSLVVSEVELNNNFRRANNLSSNTIVNGKIRSTTDVDYYKTMFYEDNDAVVILDNIPAGKDFDLYIYNNNYKLISSSNTTNSIEATRIKNVKTNEWYYIKVVGYNKSFDSYSPYTLETKHTTTKSEDIGHTFETAKPVTVVNPVVGEILYISDVNYFKFIPNENGKYIINTSGNIDTVGRLYNNNKHVLAENDDKTSDLHGNFEIKNEFKAHNVYFIQVRHYSIGTGRFNLQITKEINKPDILKNDKDNPTAVSVGVKYSDKFDSASTENWFSFTPENTGSYKIYSNGNANTYGTLYDNTKSKVIIENANIIDLNSFELSSTLLAGQTYFIKITPNVYDELNNAFDLYIKKLDNPNDSYFTDQWGLQNSEKGIDINILPAWQYTSGAGIKIGVADTGTDYRHTELANQLDLSLAYNFTHNSTDIFPLNEITSGASAAIHGHGTHIAGIIGAKANNDEGVAGIAPGATLVPLKVLGSKLKDSSAYTGSIAAFINSIEHARKNNIKIMNCSFSGSYPAVAEKEAMANASDILFVIASGNQGHDLAKTPEYPTCYYNDNSLVVASVNKNGELAESSNYGGPTEIVAPGTEIYNVSPDNNYTYKTGTSMATPAVSAISGLVWSRNLDLTPVEVKARVTASSNVTKLDNLDGKVLSGGLVNAFKAVISGNVEVRSIKSLEHLEKDIFGRDVKSNIEYYKNNANEDVKTNQIIVKFVDNVDVNEFITKINQNNNFKKIEQVEYLEIIDAYVIEFADVDEADLAVDIFNSNSSVKYAEPNYLRDIN